MWNNSYSYSSGEWHELCFGWSRRNLKLQFDYWKRYWGPDLRPGEGGSGHPVRFLAPDCSRPQFPLRAPSLLWGLSEHWQPSLQHLLFFPFLRTLGKENPVFWWRRLARPAWCPQTGIAAVVWMKERLQSWWERIKSELPPRVPSVSGSLPGTPYPLAAQNLVEFFGVCITCLSFIHVKSFLENLKRLIRAFYVCARKSPAFMIE